MSKRRAAGHNLVFNYASVAFGAVSGLGLVPLYLRHFDLATYGLWLACANGVALLSLCEGGFTIVLSQRLARAVGAGHEEDFPEVVGSSAVVAGSLSLLVLIIGLALCGSVPRWVGAGVAQRRALGLGFLLAAIGTSCQIGYYALGGLLQAWLRTFWAGVASVMALALGVLATVLGLIAGYGVVSIGLGTLVRGLVGVVLLAADVIYAWRVRRLPRPRCRLLVIRELVASTLSVSVAQILSGLLGNTQSVIATILISPEAAAVLSVLGRVYELCKMFLAPVGSAVFAGLAQIVGGGDKTRLRQVATEVLGLFSGMAGIMLGGALALNETFVAQWVGLRPAGGHVLSIALCLSALASAIVTLLRVMLTAFGEIGRTAWTSLIEVIVRLPTIALLVWIFGLIGMPLAELVSTVGVSAWFFGRLWADIVELRRGHRLRTAVQILAPPAAGIAFGLVWSSVLPPHGGWAVFGMEAVFTGIVLMVLMTLLSVPTRDLLRNLVRRATGMGSVLQ